jgi:hypothetical protein
MSLADDKTRENSSYGPLKTQPSFYGPENFELSYLTLKLDFITYLAFPSVLSKGFR